MIKTSREDTYFHVLAYAIVTLVTLACLFPFILIISGSFSDERSIFVDGYRLIPSKLSLEAYATILRFPVRVVRAYAVTTLVTSVGTTVGLFFVSMAGYVIQRRDFRFRNVFALYFYFTSLFGGGLIPWYILIARYLSLKDNLAVLILPYLMTPFFIILMKNFLRSVPDSISESAKIDGANDFAIYWRLILPLSKPGLASIGLFLALRYWNDWFLSAVFISSPEKYSLQFLLYSILQRAEFLRSSEAMQAGTVRVKMPAETLKMAMAVIVTGPVVLLYPFAQRYFVKGLTIGAVKG